MRTCAAPWSTRFSTRLQHKGLVDVLAGTIELSDALQSSEAGPMDVLVAGPVPTNPSELLGSETMLKTIRQLESSYDFVIIDTPPVLPVTDALLIGVHVNAVVVVARLGQTTRDRIRRTTAALTHVNANMAGVVPNGAIEREDSAYYYAYRYRSRRQPLDIPYAAPDPVVAPHPNEPSTGRYGQWEGPRALVGTGRDPRRECSLRTTRQALPRAGPLGGG